jgi:hypothetical protein
LRPTDQGSIPTILDSLIIFSLDDSLRTDSFDQDKVKTTAENAITGGSQLFAREIRKRKENVVVKAEILVLKKKTIFSAFDAFPPLFVLPDTETENHINNK